jgi:hypothetical protein
MAFAVDWSYLGIKQLPLMEESASCHGRTFELNVIQLQNWAGNVEIAVNVLGHDYARFLPGGGSLNGLLWKRTFTGNVSGSG